MARRVLAWALVLPLVGTSVLIGHAVACSLTDGAEGETHAYLAHAPGLLALASLVALVGLAIQERAQAVGSWPFAALGPAVFTAQEHLEGLAHTGDVPFLLADRTFVLGLALQLPVAVAAAAIVRLLVVALRAASVVRPRSLRWETPFAYGPGATSPRVRRLPVATLGRAPPAPRRP